MKPERAAARAAGMPLFYDDNASKSEQEQTVKGAVWGLVDTIQLGFTNPWKESWPSLASRFRT